MIFLIYILGIICLGLIFPKSRFVLALGFFLMFIVCTHFQAGNDISYLEDSFSNLNVNNEEADKSLLFYSGLLYLNSIGLSFFQIRCIDFAIWGLAIYIFIFKFTKYPNYVVSCSFLFPMLPFASQMRNGLMAAFLYFSITCLFSCKNKKQGIITYILLIIVGGLFHYLGFIYLLGLITLLPISTQKLRKYVFLLGAAVFILYNGGILYYLVSYISPYYAYNYFGGKFQSEWFLFVVLTMGIIINYVFAEYSEKIILRHKSCYPTQYIELSRFITRMTLISLVLLPLLQTNGSIYRFFQNIFILTIVSIANASITYFPKGKYQGNLFRLVYFCFFMLVSIFYMRWQGEFLTFFNSIKI